jgi:uncharacterized protein involved in outer membrane biogenesis
LRTLGHLSAARLVAGNLAVSNFSSSIEINSCKVSLKDVRADLLGGHHSGNWDADFTVSPPKYFGSGTVTNLGMAQVSALMHDPWATGTLDGQYTLGLSGLDPASLRASATGSASFKWTGGSLRRVVLEGKGTPLSFSSFGGQVALRNGSLVCEACKLQSAGEAFDVSGSASFARALDIRMESSGRGDAYAISGSLAEPHVESVQSPRSEAKAR